MGAEDVDAAQPVQFPRHVVVGDLAFGVDRSGDASSHEPVYEAVDLDQVPVDEPHAFRQGLAEHVGSIDVAVGDVAPGTPQRLTALLVLGEGGGPHLPTHLAGAFLGQVRPQAPHARVVRVAAPLRHLTAEALPHHVGDDPLPGAVVEEVDEVSEDEQGVAGRGQPGERLELAVDVGDDQHHLGRLRPDVLAPVDPAGVPGGDPRPRQRQQDGQRPGDVPG